MSFFETFLEKPFRIREEVVVHDKLAPLRKHVVWIGGARSVACETALNKNKNLKALNCKAPKVA
jgi:hypothetical protein